VDDIKIVDLYWQRDETAITATKEKYGAYLLRIAFNIVSHLSDSEECVNDTYFGAWNSMPPHKPTVLQTYLGKLTRRIAIDRYRKNTSAKRGSSETELLLDELEECLPAQSSVEQEMESRRLSVAINNFIRTLSREKRRTFIFRYWYSLSIKEISTLTGFSETKTANMLSRTRGALKSYLEKEDLCNG
jgi:RNA polymerase sigma-70 factor (ECF subfamily)